MSSATPRSKGDTPKPKPKASSSKPVIKVDSAFTTPKWPTIEPAEQDIILKLLCNLLEPIGHHRSNHITPSKGKRSKKRKRTSEEKTNEQAPTPPQPQITKYITTGFNSTFRHLQDTIKSTKTEQDDTKDETANQPNPTQAETQKQSQPNDTDAIRPNDQKLPPHLSTIFLTHDSPSTHPPYTPLPLLSYLSSTHHPSSLPTLLVPLSATSESLVCKALGIPRVGIIGLFEDAPGAGALVEYVREHVEVTDVPWVREVGEGTWLGTKIMFGEEDARGT